MTSFLSSFGGLRAASTLALALSLAACDDDSKSPNDVEDGGPAPVDGSQDGEPVDGTDGAPMDGGHGSQAGDAGEPDTGASDAGERDAGQPDAGGPDAGGPDAGGPDAGGPDPDASQPVTECTTTVPATENGFVALCAVDDGVRHVKIEGLLAPQVHASTQVLFGLPSAPTANQPAIGAGQFQALFYGGGVPFPPATLVGNYAGHDITFTEGASFLYTASTVCFDLSDGAADKPPYYVLWVTGQKGADCNDASTLSLASAFARETSFEDSVGTIDKSAPVFFRQAAAQEAVVTLRNESVLSVEAIEAELEAQKTCTTTWANHLDWQRLCTPIAGEPRHIRIENAASTRNNNYVYLILGNPIEDPTGTPAVTEGSGTFVLTGGKNHQGASATSFKFNSNTSTEQYDFGGLYTDAPSTLCLDLGDNAGQLKVLVWATGKNGADCADKSTLSATNVIYDSTASDTAIWNTALATTGFHFIKASNTGASIGQVVLSTELAVP